MNRALLVGINAYPGQPLAGCINDVTDVASYLESRHGFEPDAIELLCDGRATKQAIIQNLRDMIASAKSGDQLLFHYSGHGTQMPTRSTDEPDGLDEVLCPVDFNWTDATALKDNDLRAELEKIPPGVAVTCVLDACHTGDFDRDIHVRRFLKPPPDIARRMARRTRVINHLRSAADDRAAILSACAATETSADTEFDNRPNGAFTYFLLHTLRGREGEVAPLTRLVGLIAAELVPYSMHPGVTGPSEAVGAAFLAAVITRMTTSSPSASLVPTPSAPGDGDADARWRDVAAELVRLAKLDREFRTRLEGFGGLFDDIESAVAQLIVPPAVQRGPVTCHTFWWGMQLEIPHEQLASFTAGAASASAVAAAIGPMTGPAAPYIEGIAIFVAASVAVLQRMDQGNGVLVSMSWMTPGLFIPTASRAVVRNGKRPAGRAKANGSTQPRYVTD